MDYPTSPMSTSAYLPGGFSRQNSRRSQDEYIEELRPFLQHPNRYPDTHYKAFFTKQYPLGCGRGEFTPTPKDTVSDEQIKIYLDKLSALNAQLNEVKSRLNDKELKTWREHTEFMHIFAPTPRAVRRKTNAELCTRAWLKFYNILTEFLVMEKGEENVRTVHLCEAPGAFVAATNHYLRSHCPNVNWEWWATTLNPYHEDNSTDRAILDDAFMLNTWNRWVFGADNTGNIMSEKNLHALEKLVPAKANLVTADGSIDCQDDPENQETMVGHLHLCEVITALTLLAVNGNFVLKTFTLYEPFTASMVYLLTCCFSKVYVYKPACSKPGNSELYLVCMNFSGINNENEKGISGDEFRKLQKRMDQPSEEPLIPLQAIPSAFWECHFTACNYFYRKQKEAIENNIFTFEMKGNSKAIENQKAITTQREEAPAFFIRHCHLQPLDRKFVLMKNTRQNNKFGKSRHNAMQQRSFNDRQAERELDWPQYVQQLGSRLRRSNCGPLKKWITESQSPEIVTKAYREPTVGATVTVVKNCVAADSSLLQLYNELLLRCTHIQHMRTATAVNIPSSLSTSLSAPRTSPPAVTSPTAANPPTALLTPCPSSSESSVGSSLGSRPPGDDVRVKRSPIRGGSDSRPRVRLDNKLFARSMGAVRQENKTLRPTPEAATKAPPQPVSPVATPTIPSAVQGTSPQLPLSPAAGLTRTFSTIADSCSDAVLGEVRKFCETVINPVCATVGSVASLQPEKRPLEFDILSECFAVQGHAPDQGVLHIGAVVELELREATHQSPDSKRDFLRLLLKSFSEMKHGDALLLRVPDCLSRYNIAVVFVAALAFHSVTLLNASSDSVYVHANHLLCINFTHTPPTELLHYLKQWSDREFKKKDSDVLELIGMNMLYTEGQQFLTGGGAFHHNGAENGSSGCSLTGLNNDILESKVASLLAAELRYLQLPPSVPRSSITDSFGRNNRQAAPMES